MVSFPLPHYDGSAGSAKSAGEKAVNQQSKFEGVKSSVSSNIKTAAGNSSDDLPPAISSSSKSTEDDAHTLGSASVVAGGAMKAFGRAIKTYNGRIDDLNSEYRTAKANNFNVSMSDVTVPPTVAQDGGKQARQDAFDEAVEEADVALRERLEGRRKKYKKTLDDEGDSAAGMLDKNPSGGSVLALVMSGDVPASAAAPYVGMTVSQLNALRGHIGTYKGAKTQLGNFKLTGRYLWEKFGKGLKGKNIKNIVYKDPAVKSLLAANRAQRLDLAERVAKYKTLKKALPGSRFTRDFLKHNDLRDPKLTSRFKNAGGFFGKANKVAGKALAPLGVVASGYGMYDTISNWDNLSTEKKVTGLTGNTAGLVSGGLGTYAAFAGGAAALGPVGVGVAAVAGGVALGVLVYENREAIADGAKAAAGYVGDLVTDPVETVDKTLDAAGDAAGAVADTAKDVGEGVKDFFGF